MDERGGGAVEDIAVGHNKSLVVSFRNFRKCIISILPTLC